jgi:ammonium transporter, Amt family
MNPAPTLSGPLCALLAGLLILAPLAMAGLALINAGLGRSRSAAQSLVGSLAIVSVAVVIFAAIGSIFAGSSTAVSIHVAGRDWNLLGLGPWLLRGSGAMGPEAELRLLFECLAAALAGLIPWGAGADRLRLAAGMGAAALTSAFLFPLLAHWIWGGGWLAALGANFGLGAGFLDSAGGASIHAFGGLSALAVVWIAGPRRGKFPREGLATAMPAHHAAFVLFGCLLALVGWLAWNAAGAILWLHAEPAALAGTVLNTLLCAAGALLATFAVTRIRFGKPDASLCANGWMAGLVTSSACAALVTPGDALFIGAVAGIFTPLLVEVLELALSIDDPTGAIAVHGVGGLWGLFAAGLFASQRGQFLAQLVGIATILGVFLPLNYGLFALINRLIAFRVEPDGERLGMDLHELGGGAYPEFVIHRDDSYR